MRARNGPVIVLPRRAGCRTTGDTPHGVAEQGLRHAAAAMKVGLDLPLPKRRVAADSKYATL